MRQANSQRAGPFAPVAKMTGTAAARFLHITRGMHRGASLPLRQGSTILGSAPDCDLLLADSGVAPHHLEITYESGMTSVKRIDDATLRVDGRDVLGRLAILPPGVMVEVGECAFRLASSASFDERGPQPKASGSTGLARQSTVAYAAIGALVVLCAVLAWEFFTSNPLTANQLALSESTPESAEDRFAKSVSALAASDLKVERLGPNNFRLSGFVDDQAQARQLGVIIRDAPHLRIESNFVVGTQAASWIRDSIASPQLTVKYVGGGKVVIEGEIEGAAYRDRLAQVHAQFSRVIQVEDRTRPSPRMPPPVVKAPAKVYSPLSVMPAGIKANGQAIFVVSDGKERYFAGATLPDGRIVVSINAKGAKVQKPDGSVVQAGHEP